MTCVFNLKYFIASLYDLIFHDVWVYNQLAEVLKIYQSVLLSCYSQRQHTTARRLPGVCPAPKPCSQLLTVPTVLVLRWASPLFMPEVKAKIDLKL